MKQARTLLIFVLCVVPMCLGAQNAMFVNTPSDARSAAMGNTGYAMSANAFAANYNTAGILFSDATGAVEASYLDWQPDGMRMQMWSLGGFCAISDKIGIAAALRFNIHDSYMRTDEYGNFIDDFTPYEFSGDIGVAYRIAHRLALAATLRFINSDMGGPEKGNAFAVDLDAYYDIGRLGLGLGVSNLGSEIGYGYSKLPLPMRLKAGIDYTFVDSDLHMLTGLAEIDYQLNPQTFRGATLGLGAEYAFMDLISLRAGYNLSDKKTTGDSYGSVGMGLSFHLATIDVAYILAASDSMMKNTLLVSLGCLF